MDYVFAFIMTNTFLIAVWGFKNGNIFDETIKETIVEVLLFECCCSFCVIKVVQSKN